MRVINKVTVIYPELLRIVFITKVQCP